MDLRMLGPLEVSVRGRELALGGRRQRALIALLALHANEAVSKERLVDDLWPDEPFESAVNTLHVTVSRTRKVLADAMEEPRLITKPPGYLLAVGPEELDTVEFERLLAEGRDALVAGDPAAALDRLRDGDALWRGPALSDFAYEPFAQHNIARLEELKLLAIEERIQAELLLGLSGRVTTELESLVAAHPLRERFRAQLMLSLYRSGRQAEALAAFDRAREFLGDELGIDPGPELVELQLAILRQDPDLDADRPTLPVGVSFGGAARTVQPRHARKTVTVLAALLTEVDAEALDAEVLTRVRANTFENAAQVLRQHGGTVQPPMGDTVVATFGMPVAHEDDLLRALRAAVALRAITTELNQDLDLERGVPLAVRIGIESGEVVAEDDRPVALGGPVSAASRLALVADYGDILMGPTAYRLGAHAVRSDSLGDGAWRVVELVRDAVAIPRRHDSPLVGRDAEMLQLQNAFERAVTSRSAQVLTVVGEAGIGKTRLVEEFALRLGERAQVLKARCLSYGDDVTFGPLRELVHQAARGQAATHIRALLPDDAEADAVAEEVATALGAKGDSTTLDPIWAFRKLIEALGRRQPLVLLVDDVHWAEPPLVDLIRRVRDQTRDAPVLVICAARPELLDAPSPFADHPLGERLSLRPLTVEESEVLVDNLPGRDPPAAHVRSRIVGTAEGNPLFVEQLLAFHSGTFDVDDDPLLPPTIQALLAARLDRLGPGERACLDSAAIVGKEFWVDAVLELVPGEARSSVPRHLVALETQKLVSPPTSSDREEGAFRFAHVLIQETTYRSISKARRAALHESLGRWLEQNSASDEVIGFHLERAYRYRLELGAIDVDSDELRTGAALHLSAAGRAAFARSDAGAAHRLLTRAVALLDEDDPLRLELTVRIAEASVERGDLDLAGRLTSAVLADERTSAVLAAYAALTRLRVQIENADVEEGQIAKDLARPMAVFETEGDRVGLAFALTFLARDHWLHGRSREAAAALEETIRQAEKTGGRRRATYAAYWLSIAFVHGHSPINEAIRRCEELARQRPGLPLLKVGLLSARAAGAAMNGTFAQAHRQCAQAITILEDLGQMAEAAAMDALIAAAIVDRLAGDVTAMEERLRASLSVLEDLGDVISASKAYSFLADALYVQDRLDEAEALTVSAEQTAAADVDPKVRWRRVRAKVRARQGASDEGLDLAREAVALARETQLLTSTADALLDLTEVLELRGETSIARPHVEDAIELYREKGNLVQARSAERILDKLPSAPTSDR